VRDLGQQLPRVAPHFDILLLAADVEDQPHLALGVGLGGDDEEAVEEVDGDAVGAGVWGWDVVWKLGLGWGEDWGWELRVLEGCRGLLAVLFETE